MSTTHFKISPDARLFEVRYIGELSYLQRAQAIEATEQRLKDCWIKQLLIDFSASWVDEPADPKEIEHFRTTLMRATFPRGMRVALLNPPGSADGPTQQMSRTMHYMCRKFHDRGHALAWLRGRL
jgi:hypothetical protein